MAANKHLLREVLHNVSFCHALPAGAMEPQLMREIVHITGLQPHLIVRLGRLIAITGNLTPLQQVLRSDSVTKAPGLRYQLKVHSRLCGAGLPRQEARQGVTLLVVSERGQIALTLKVRLARTTLPHKGETRLAHVQWIWVIDTPAQRQVRRHAYVVGGVRPRQALLAGATPRSRAFVQSAT